MPDQPRTTDAAPADLPAPAANVRTHRQGPLEAVRVPLRSGRSGAFRPSPARESARRSGPRANGLVRAMVLGALALLLAPGSTALLDGAEAPKAPGAGGRKTQNVFLLTADGLRWQEVFRGAEDLPLTKEFGNFGSSNAIRKEFWRPTPEARREVLMPFLWETVAKQGQIWGIGIGAARCA